MPKELLNEAERFLLDHWEEARLLEESMEVVRTKYKSLFQQIVDAVTEAHPELDAQRTRVTQFWANGYLGFGRKSWPSGASWHSGFWVENLRLEILTAEDTDPPWAYIWAPKKCNLDFDAARAAVKKVAKDLLLPEELKGSSDGSGEELINLPAPSKHTLLSSLSTGDGQGFVKLLISQFDMMARFVPVLEKVFRECLGKEEK
jgi:hypothetical protein